MIAAMLNDPQSETSLGDLLPLRVKAILEKNGVHTAEALRMAYPDQLLRMRGMGMLRFKQIEAAFFPGESFTPTRIHSTLRHIKGSSLNGALSPAVVRALAGGGVTTVDQLRATERKELLAFKGLGPTKLREIERVFPTIIGWSKRRRQADA